MRRQIGRFLPVVMIAMWVQIFAPIGAYFAMAAAMDPFGSAPICSPLSMEKSGQTAPDGQPSHQNCCELCVVSQSGSASLSSPAPIVVAVLRSPERVAWQDRHNDLVADPRSSPAQARAPPSHS
ncbi:MAG: DUF2946 domain-containing protein [Afipia sp.]|nr:DUF2946 domain-containing protein [Afipia sp.]